MLAGQTSKSYRRNQHQLWSRCPSGTTKALQVQWPSLGQSVAFLGWGNRLHVSKRSKTKQKSTLQKKMYIFQNNLVSPDKLKTIAGFQGLVPQKACNVCSLASTCRYSVGTEHAEGFMLDFNPVGLLSSLHRSGPIHRVAGHGQIEHPPLFKWMNHLIQTHWRRVCRSLACRFLQDNLSFEDVFDA